MPEIFLIIFQILKTWWWLLLPIILYFLACYFYLWWLRWEVWYKEKKWIFLEIKPPKKTEKPFRAMEDVFSILWGIYGSPNWREYWCLGMPPRGPEWFSLEIVSIGGEVHFYLRIIESQRKKIESVFYSHYPEIEIFEAQDYTKSISKDVPNEDWDLYGEEFVFLKEHAYPIKTFEFFEIAPGTEIEKKVHPIASFMEDLMKLQSGEQFWFQILVAPILDKDIPWQSEGKEIVDRIAKRPKKPKPKPLIREAAEVIVPSREEIREIVWGKPAKRETAPKPPEEKEAALTPGEKKIVEDIENKIKKLGFKTTIRIIYLWKKDLFPFQGPNYLIGRSYLGHFVGENKFVSWGETRTRIHYLLKKRRLYLRKRKIFRNYIERIWPMFPRFPKKGYMILNTEELATIYQFPTKAAVPTLPYIEAKRGAPPPVLPIE
jgi:hypothetical protein